MKFVKRSDWIVIASMAIVCLLAIIGYRAIVSGKACRAEIYYHGELVQTVDLGQGRDYSFSIPQNANVVFHVYADGSIAFESSDCLDKVCVRAGRLSVIGQSAACLPNGILLKIVGNGDDRGNAPDVVVGK